MTTFRYAVWASDTGEASHWKLARAVNCPAPAIYENKDVALTRATQLIRDNHSVVVEQWDDGRNVFLKTIFEHTRGPTNELA